MAVDCFLCYAEHDGELAQLRTAMYGVCLARWRMQPDIELHVLKGKGVSYQRQRRIYAESHATSSVYLVADDDCLLLDNPFYVQRILNAMEAYPDFAILAAYPDNSSLQPWTPENLEVIRDCTVEEHVSVGGLYAIRKGLMTEWPEMNGHGYDMIQADYLRSKGYRVGFLKNGFSINHLGKNYSTVWP